eukprot:CAMPEP_0174825458 /NCGR_PEP_ID=MMETSP1107-20130205/42774_1 /TAXON_ID=36770 /ORGANISM="Paraphysomonas vestita, Strain GFlagA" /LENGTH=330 /DNA_ID=CAMNT_0016057083 /DNA_START=416 /DNA_END=1405 /DNA_ORIENTATION=-
MMEVAMERCDNARCAIKTMGDLATTYGFYGNDPGNEGAGEAVVIADAVSETWVFHVTADDTGESAVWVAQRVPDDEIAVIANQYIIGEIDLSNPDYFMASSAVSETWVFHVTADDTGESAVWVAQRVPDDHITVVPNQFIIREINLDNPDYYLASSNIFEVAIRNNLWSSNSGVKFDYLKIYGYDIGSEGYMATRRTWRVFTLAAPSIHLNPLTDSFGSFGYGPDGTQPYPFSIKPDTKLTLVDIMKMTRDTFEGTPFDLSKGLAAGPFGDVMRYEALPSSIDPVNGINYPNESSIALMHERPISLYRTVYASIAQARKKLPDSIGAVVW